MATRSSLGTVASATTIAISDGTTAIEGQTITATNLLANSTLKTNGDRHIISANLLKSDIKDLGTILENPLTENLNADGKNIINVGDLETTLVNGRGILYNPSVANLSMANFNINNVNNINTQTINAKTPLYNPSVAVLDMNNFNIINSPTLTTLEQKTQYLTTSAGLNSFAGDVRSSSSFNAPVLSVGNILTTGYSLPTTKAPGSNYSLTSTSGNTTQWTFANLSSIFNLSAVANISSTFVGSLFIGGGKYSFPNATPLADQYLSFTSGGVGFFKSLLAPSTYIRFNRNLTLGSVSQLTSPINTRISLFPLLVNEATSPSSVFTTTASGAEYNFSTLRPSFSMSYNTLAQITTNPSGGEFVFRLIHRRLGAPAESVISSIRIFMKKDIQYTISIQAVGFDMAQGDVLDVSLEGSILSTVELDSQQVSIIAH